MVRCVVWLRDSGVVCWVVEGLCVVFKYMCR